MKTYTNHKFNLVEDDDIVSRTNKTDTVCIVLAIIAIMLIVATVITIGGLK